MENQIKKIIYDWVGQNFGSQEADDPSWNIEALAQEIDSKLNEKSDDVISLKYGEILVVDPCYIKNVSDGVDNRFDALRLERVLHEGDDGEYAVKYTCSGDDWTTTYLGVDSGRLWLLRAEFDCDVEVDSGFSGHLALPEHAKVAIVDIDNNYDDEGDE